MKFKIEVGVTEMIYARIEEMKKIETYLEIARYWKLEGETEFCRDALKTASIYRNIVKAIDNKIW